MKAPRGRGTPAAHAVLSPDEFLVSDKRGERALKKEKNRKKKIKLPSRKAKGCFPEMMHNGISTF